MSYIIANVIICEVIYITFWHSVWKESRENEFLFYESMKMCKHTKIRSNILDMRMTKWCLDNIKNNKWPRLSDAISWYVSQLMAPWVVWTTKDVSTNSLSMVLMNAWTFMMSPYLWPLVFYHGCIKGLVTLRIICRDWLCQVKNRRYQKPAIEITFF